jgi:hypothetical protein
MRAAPYLARIPGTTAPEHDITETRNDLHQNIEVAAFLVLAARHGAEDARVLHRIARNDLQHLVAVMLQGFGGAHRSFPPQAAAPARRRSTCSIASTTASKVSMVEAWRAL